LKEEYKDNLKRTRKRNREQMMIQWTRKRKQILFSYKRK